MWTLVFVGRKVPELELAQWITGGDQKTRQGAIRIMYLYGERNWSKIFQLFRQFSDDSLVDLALALWVALTERFQHYPYSNDEEQARRDAVVWRFIDELSARVLYADNEEPVLVRLSSSQLVGQEA